MTTQELEQEIKRLEKKLCCKLGFYDALVDFPEVGVKNRLYIDKATVLVYIWDGEAYVTA